MTLSVRPLQDSDLDVANTIAVAAFQASNSRKEELFHYLHLQPDGYLLVLLDNQPVGLGGLVNYGVFAYLGMMSVLPSLQGQGVGKELMKHLMAWADARACPTILLDATNTGSYLYRQFGFIEESKTARWERNIYSETRPADLYHPHISMNLTNIQATALPELLAFDAPCFGAERASVLAGLLERYPERAFITRDAAGHISGYLFAQKRHIGPWAAQTPADAECLLARALLLPFFEETISVNITVANSAGAQLLERYGFSRQDTLSHMRRGRSVQRDLQKIYGQASFALG